MGSRSPRRSTFDRVVVLVLALPLLAGKLVRLSKLVHCCGVLLLLLRLLALALLRILLLPPPSSAVAVLPSETCGGGGKTTIAAAGVATGLSQPLVLLAAAQLSAIWFDRREWVGEDELDKEWLVEVEVL